jgi:hypothetical protein
MAERRRADNDGTNPDTKMLLNADFLVLYSPSLATSVSVTAVTTDLAATINTTGAGGRDRTSAYTGSEALWSYWIWGSGPGLSTIFSTARPAVGPTLPTSYTHYSPCFTTTLSSTGPSLNPTVPQGGTTTMKVRDRTVFYNNCPLFEASSTSSSYAPTIDVSSWVPPDVAQTQLWLDSEMTAAVVPMIAGTICGTTLGNFSNQSLYAFTIGNIAASDTNVSVALPDNRTFTANFLFSAGRPATSTFAVFVEGYTF